MCGINLIFAYAAGSAGRDELRRTRDAMQRRGPDASGEWFSPDGRLALGHRRLSIIDTSHDADQPMLSHDSRFAIVFNGEIYNHRALRAGLDYPFVTQSDTEVLLALFAAEGAAMLGRLRGMFALAIWDARERKLFLARDPYGIKPLYYSRDGGVLRVASQVKAMVAGGGVSRAVDPGGVAGFLIRGTVPEPFTTYDAIKTLPAGSYAVVDAEGKIEITRYFSLAEVFRSGVEAAPEMLRRRGEWGEIVREAVAESVRDHLVSDVPIGAFLSSGKDSGTVLALAAEAGAQDLTAVTIGCHEFAGTELDEVPLAARLASSYGLRHVVRMLSRDEFMGELEEWVDAMDQPSIDGFNTYFVAKAARELGLKVMLSGTGGDELFGGYKTFRRIPRFVRWTRVASRVPGLERAFRAGMGFLGRRGFSTPKTIGTLTHCRTYHGAYMMKRGLFIPEELVSVLPADFAEEGLRRLQLPRLMEAAITPDPGSPFARVATLEGSYFLRDQLLRDIDWASMAHSVEVRVPLVDARLLRRIVPVLCAAEDREKTLLAAAPRRPLPAELLRRPKTGFLLPTREWMKPLRRAPHTFGMRSFALMLVENHAR